MKKLFAKISGLKLRVKLALIGFLSVLITSIFLLGVVFWQSGNYSARAQSEIKALSDSDLSHITMGVYHMVQAQNESIQKQIDYNLNVAKYLLEQEGAVSLSRETVNWTAINQATQDSVEIQLPKLMVGGEWVGKNSDPEVETPIVDSVRSLVGETSTIFQRMNSDGDMLRVATNVINASGERAIGTYIPAVDETGTPSPIIQAVLAGETYHGRAFVVNAWYITAYKPIWDTSGSIVGMLYVGIKQENVTALREAILNTKVGETGYVGILGAEGNQKGHYIISQNGARDGEDISQLQDSNGNFFVQDIIEKALQLQAGEISTTQYLWQNADGS